MKVYLLTHNYEFCDSIETKFLGIYTSRKKAQEAKLRFLSLTGFNKYPESCFDIQTFSLTRMAIVGMRDLQIHKNYMMNLQN